MIEVSHLRKEYRNLVAVEDVSFKLVPGEILGFLGPNGAGKSTTMKMLTGFLAPTSGDATVWGCDVLRDSISAQAHIGYLPEGAPCYEEMTPTAFLRFIAEVRGYRGSDISERVSRAAATMSLEKVMHQKIETLSKGFKRRVGLAQAILHDPDVLILDEPTDGLDPNQKRQVREMITGLSKDKIVIISTHILEEVTAVCNRVMVLSGGRIVSDTTPAELLRQSRYHGALSVLLADDESMAAMAALLQNDKEVSEIHQGEAGITIFPVNQDGSLLPRVYELIQDNNWQLASVHVEQGRLDEVFQKLTEGGV
jgi:ABC-2 type transport system ATP-binding protein